MRKASLFVCVAIGIAFTSCKEKGPLIDFGGTKAEDTTYTVSDPGAAQQRMVLIEEFTGGNCPYCPQGHEYIYGPDGIKAKHPDRVAVIAYHINNYNQAEPAHGAKYDFRTVDATDVCNTVFGGIAVGMPSASFDRSPENGEYLLDRAKWVAKSDERFALPSSANLTLDNKYDSTTREAVITVKVVYTAPVAKKQALTLAIVESNIIDAQKNVSTIDPAYVHRSVLRDIITPFYGSPIIDSVATKAPGRVYERTFKFKVSDAWNASNCDIVAFVHNNNPGDKEVVQAIEKPLK